MMRGRTQKVIQDLKDNAPQVEQLQESIEFLEWVNSGYFVYTGYAEFELVVDDKKVSLREVANTACGLLRRYGGDLREESVDGLSEGVKALYEDDQVLTVSKSSKRSRVHRNAYSDYIVVKRFNDKGEPVGEVRLLGLYTSQFYSYSPRRIPILREKVNWVLERAGFSPNSHDGKALSTILDSHPRDELLHISREILSDTAIGIWQIYERRVVKVFVHPDPFEKFVNCLVYLPRESYSTDVREIIQQRIGTELDAVGSEFTAEFVPDSVLIRIYLVYKIQNKHYLDVNTESLQVLVEQTIRDWSGEFQEQALSQFGLAEGATLSLSLIHI